MRNMPGNRNGHYNSQPLPLPQPALTASSTAAIPGNSGFNGAAHAGKNPGVCGSFCVSCPEPSGADPEKRPLPAKSPGENEKFASVRVYLKPLHRAVFIGDEFQELPGASFIKAPGRQRCLALWLPRECPEPHRHAQSGKRSEAAMV